MKMEPGKTRIKIYNLAENKFCDESKLKKIVMDVLKKERVYSLTLVNIIIANASYLKELNKKFFKHNKTTNVISFNLGDTGEIYISNDEVDIPEDLYYYMVHGLLHILGYDHKTKKTESFMDAKCRKYIKKFLSD
uniref:Endoribonuclease YbeY n=1 Tax=candidate division WOR-3 bacterium TaxID=2052148 RepID=A0A7V0Z3K5_UNCW3